MEPEAVREAVLSAVRDFPGISQAAFDRMKRSAFGRRIKGLDSFDATCFRLCAYAFSDFDYFRFPEIYKTIQKEDVENSCLSVIFPVREGDEET